MRSKRVLCSAGGAVGVALIFASAAAASERIENDTAVFAALDKVTARISKLEVPLNQTVQFGSLKLTPRVCYSRPPTEPPKTSTFVQVEEVELDGREKRLFSGWMFAESPGLNAVEHPVFDVWLTGCKGGTASASSTQAQPKTSASKPRRRRRRLRQ
ncbi:MAG: DUF2155 domain-containing protein [Pseudomonadota bacterium]